MESVDEDSLVRRRPRRSTAGNWMEAALAEMAALHPEPELEADDDQDFLNPMEEDEVFDSDFQSTDDEAAQEDEATAEKAIVEEEKLALKSVRQRTARAVETRATTSGAISKGTPGSVAPVKAKGKMHMGSRRALARGAIHTKSVDAVSNRKSRRQSTMLSSQILHSRLQDAEERKALMPKRAKEATVTFSQAELLARALDTEEGNIVSHRNYLEDEEEKRRRARVVKQKLSGPVLSWISRSEDIKTSTESAGSSNARDGNTAHFVTSTPDAPAPSKANAGKSLTQQLDDPTHSHSHFVSSTALDVHLQPPLPTPPAEIEKVCKNYLVHRVDLGMPKPKWAETMTAVFGAHVNWEEVKVYSGKHRPLSRPVNRCPITGQTGIYCDPRTGVPFANIDAFKTLSRIISHEYIWNEELGCYTADEKAAQLEPDSDNITDSSPSADALSALPTT